MFWIIHQTQHSRIARKILQVHLVTTRTPENLYGFSSTALCNSVGESCTGIAGSINTNNFCIFFQNFLPSPFSLKEGMGKGGTRGKGGRPRARRLHDGIKLLLAGGIKLLFHFICIMCTHVAHVQK